MATIKFKGNEYYLKDGSIISGICEKIGVPFACHQGTCGICEIKILDGEQNLNSLTDNEKILEMSRKKRLACQCNISKGIVDIDFD